MVIQCILGKFQGLIWPEGDWPSQVANQTAGCSWNVYSFNSSPPGQNGHHFAEDFFRCIFVNEKFCILLKISLKFVRKVPISNNPSLVQKMAWCWIGDKPCWPDTLTHICSTRGRWVNYKICTTDTQFVSNSLWLGDVQWCHSYFRRWLVAQCTNSFPKLTWV